MPTHPKPANNRVATLVYDGLCLFEFACASEVFGLARPELGADWYRFETCATTPVVHGQYGAMMQVDAGLDQLANAGTVVIPGWQGIDVPVPVEVVNALRAAHANGARLLSICSGATVLAATGLLDGKRAATHWRYADALRRAWPAVTIDADVLYVDEGQLLTSAGSAAGLDLCLHLVRRDYGAEVANHVARRLVIPPHRDGGQAQFVERPVAVRERDPMASVMTAMRSRLHEPLSIEGLAAIASMSERSFIRHFRAATGSSPGDWLAGLRVDRARELLEGSALSIDVIAERSGFGTATTLRHHFRRRLGTSPGAYRDRFGQLTARPQCLADSRDVPGG